MRLSIIIPIYNERTTIQRALLHVCAAPTPGYSKEIILVDDGSTDGTADIVARLAARYHLTCLRHEQNKGKGSAIRTALAQATGDLVLIQDADCEYDPADYPKLLGAYKPHGPVVYGSRNLEKANRGYSHYVLGAALLTRLTNVLFGSHLTDMYTCYKLIPRALLQKITLMQNGFSFEAEVTARILQKHIPIIEVPISYHPRSFAEGKKIRVRDGISGIWTIIRARFK